jgi:hypothetical protein
MGKLGCEENGFHQECTTRVPEQTLYAMLNSYYHKYRLSRTPCTIQEKVLYLSTI